MDLSAPDDTPKPALAWPPLQLQAALVRRGVTPGRAREACRRLGQALWGPQQPWPEIVAGLPAMTRAHVAALCTPPAALVVQEQLRAADGTLKLCLLGSDGQAFEAAVFPSRDGRRATLCVSCQIGCARRCAFCRTGRMGLQRNLSAAEIVGQLLAARRCWQQPGAPPISRVAFMGMGEPLDNVSEVVRAIGVFAHPWGGGIAARHMTVSTSGVSWRLPLLLDAVRVNIAVSLNAPDDARRRMLMPVNAHAGMAELRATLLAHLPAGRHVLLAYVLIDQFNATPADADLLADWLQGLPARVNLIPSNPGPTPSLRRPTEAAMAAFADRLRARGVRVLFRRCKGAEIAAACGQLAVQPQVVASAAARGGAVQATGN